MRVDSNVSITESLVIYESMRSPGRGSLDPITVILRDFGGQGQIIVECYGAAWSYWFGAIGSCTLKQFIASCDEYYLGGKLASTTVRSSKKSEELYVIDIARAIIEAMKGGAE